MSSMVNLLLKDGQAFFSDSTFPWFWLPYPIRRAPWHTNSSPGRSQIHVFWRRWSARWTFFWEMDLDGNFWVVSSANIPDWLWIRKTDCVFEGCCVFFWVKMVGLFVEVKVNQGSFITKSYVVISVIVLIVLIVAGLDHPKTNSTRWLFQTMFISTKDWGRWSNSWR